MDKDKAAKRDGKARSAFNVSEQHTFIHPGYDIVLDGRQIGPTGLLVIARLRPRNAKVGTLPEFILRWDEKDNRIDVDPVNVSKAKKSQFYGHHAAKLPSSPWVFEVNIEWDGRPVYQGEIRFNLAREAEATAVLGLSASASVNYRKGNG